MVQGREMNKEHLWPKWLITKTNTHQTTVRWGEKMVNPKSATLPLCKKCNSDFGDGLEAPVSQIFEDLERGKGISDLEVELLVRWLWKLEGLGWIFQFPEGRYTNKYTLRERVLHPIDDIRGQLTVAISLIEEIDPSYGDAPLGIDSRCQHSAIFVAGVFLKVAVMVVLALFEHLIPKEFSQYRLAFKPDSMSSAKIFYPQVGFKLCTEAVGITTVASIRLTQLHDAFALGTIRREQRKRQHR